MPRSDIKKIKNGNFDKSSIFCIVFSVFAPNRVQYYPGACKKYIMSAVCGGSKIIVARVPKKKWGHEKKIRALKEKLKCIGNNSLCLAFICWVEGKEEWGYKHEKREISRASAYWRGTYTVPNLLQFRRAEIEFKQPNRRSRKPNKVSRHPDKQTNCQDSHINSLDVETNYIDIHNSTDN